MNTYLRLLSYVKPYWKHVLLSVGFTVIYAILNGASVYLTIPLLDALFQSGNNTEQTTEQKENSVQEIIPENVTSVFDDAKSSFQDFIFDGTQSEILVKICVLIFIVYLGKNIFGYLQAFFLAYVEQTVIKDIRDRLYEHLQKLPMSYYKGEKTGNLISRIINDVYVVQTSVSLIFFNLIREPLTILVFLLIAISISWELTLFSFVVLPFSLFFIAWIGIKLRKESAILQEKMADLTTVIHETISGIKIVKAFGMENFENKKFVSETHGLRQIFLRMVRIRNAASPITEILSVLVGVVIIYYGGQLVLIEGTLKPSEFLGFLFSIFSLMPPVKELSSINNRIQESSAAGDRIFSIIDIEPSIKDEPGSKPLKEFSNSVEFKNVSFHYDDADELILDNINLSVKKGQIIAFVGSSGAGKTTLVDLIPRFFDPTSGAIFIDGVDIKKITLNSLRKMMGVVTQETVLFNDTVKNNIAYGLTDYPEQKIIDAVKAANAEKFINELPKGFETIIGEKGTKLSGGQRQRISIARALLKNPPIMIFDEATSALDNESEILVQEAIERLMFDRTTFVIAHRLSTIRNADKIVVMDKGKIVQTGKHDELLKDKTGIYSKLYELQFRD